MSSREYATPLRLEVQASSRLRRLLFAAMAVAALGIALCALPGWVKLAAVLSLFTGLVVFRVYDTTGGTGALVWHEGNRWSGGIFGAETDAELEPDFFVTSALAILNFRSGGKRRSLVLLSDSLPGDQFRRLRVRLRLHRARGSQTSH